MLSTLALAAHPVYWAGPWAGGFGFLFLLIPLFWIGVFVIIFSIARRRRVEWYANGNPALGGAFAAARSAESTLAERFAQGDIDETEYRARLEVLRANNYQQRPQR